MSEVPRQPLKPEDLERVYIRAQNEQGEWGNVNCAEATNEQFDKWIRSRLAVLGGFNPWSLEERTEVCNVLWLQGALHILAKEVKE